MQESLTAKSLLTQPVMKIITLGILSLSVFLSALGVVYNKHLSRQLFTKLQYLQQDIEALQLEWSQLLLEQGTWASEARVDRLSRDHLRMILPEANEVMVIKE